MELDDMKRVWQEVSAKLDGLQSEYKSLRLDVRKNAAAPPLRRTGAMIWCELLSNGLMVVLLGVFVTHQEAARYIAPALLLMAASIALLASSVLQVRSLLQIDFGDRVVAIQESLERLYVLRLRVIKVTVLLVCLLWVPLAIVLARVISGFDLYSVGSGWIETNVALGIVAIPVLWALARVLGRAFERARWGRFLLDDMTGHGLAEARRRIAALADFAADAQ
ncbi:MAG: hypothetical protein EPN38_00635 [Rhodanobacteraceae bacterium]|nr:MAG: hypothetical protein EPN38_00635 [Rhodanobacteraceae bacterium]